MNEFAIFDYITASSNRMEGVVHWEESPFTIVIAKCLFLSSVSIHSQLLTCFPPCRRSYIAFQMLQHPVLAWELPVASCMWCRRRIHADFSLGTWVFSFPKAGYICFIVGASSRGRSKHVLKLRACFCRASEGVHTPRARFCLCSRLFRAARRVPEGAGLWLCSHQWAVRVRGSLNTYGHHLLLLVFLLDFIWGFPYA